MTIDVYTDGGCSGNPGPGGWAYVALIDGETKRASGFEAFTTNNRMELTAVIRALEDISGFSGWDDASVVVATDSQYVQKGMSEWVHGWIKNGWQTSAKKAVKNRDLWMRLYDLATARKATFRWVRGHVGDEYNEMCDAMVQAEIRTHT